MPEILFIEIDIFSNSIDFNTSIQALTEPEPATKAISPPPLIYRTFNTVGAVARTTCIASLNHSNISGMLATGHSRLVELLFSAGLSRSISPTMSANSNIWELPTVISRPTSISFSSYALLKTVSQRIIFLIFSYYCFLEEF